MFFLRIAEHGYDHASAAFYPLYPALVAVLGRVFLGHYIVAGIVISLTAALGAFLLLQRLAEERLGLEGARRAVLYLAALADGCLPRRRLQRVALPAARARGVRPGRAGPLRERGNRDRAGDPHAGDRPRAPAGARAPRVAKPGPAALARGSRARPAGRGRVPARPMATDRRPVGVRPRAGALAPAPLRRRPARRDLGRSPELGPAWRGPCSTRSRRTSRRSSCSSA